MITPIILTVYFKKFLEQFGLLEFGDMSISLPVQPLDKEDLLLTCLYKIQNENPDHYQTLFNSIEKEWEIRYNKDGKLDIPKILGQLVKLVKEIRDSGVGGISLCDELSNKTEQKDVSLISNRFMVDSSQRVWKNALIIKSNDYTKSNQVTIYEDDERIEDRDDRINFNDTQEIIKKYFNEKPTTTKYEKIIQNLNKTILITNALAISDNGEGFDYIQVEIKKLFEITFKDYDDKCFCESERFANEYSMLSKGMYLGSGVILSESVLLTCGHVVARNDNSTDKKVLMKDLRFIRGYDSLLTITSEGGKIMVKIPKSKVYTVDNEKFAGGDYLAGSWCSFYDQASESTEDWAILPYKHLFDNYNETEEQKIEIENNPVKDGERLYLAGNPLGLFMKFNFDGKAKIEINPYHEVYYSSIDAFGGNSGSPVFNANNHRLVGLLVAPYNERSADVIQDETGCIKINQYLIDSGDHKGHKIQKIDTIYTFIEKSLND